MIHYIRNHEEVDNIFFYTQPYSHPFYSFIHRNIRMDFVTDIQVDHSTAMDEETEDDEDVDRLLRNVSRQVQSDALDLLKIWMQFKGRIMQESKQKKKSLKLINTLNNLLTK